MKNIQPREKHKKIVCVDVDDVCADLVPHWISLYNEEYNDTLCPEDMLEWNILNFVKPECGEDIFKYLKGERNIYREISPVKGALKYTKLLKERDYRLVYVTFRGPFSNSGRKFMWLYQNGFVEDEADYIETNDKSLIYADYMIDDNWENVINFRGTGVLYSRPWNNKYNSVFRVNTWREFYDFIVEREAHV